MKQPNIFEILPQAFFDVLASKQQAIYADTLLLIYNYLAKGNLVNAKKDILIEFLESYLDINKQNVLMILRKLKECGWIFEGETGNNEVFVTFYCYAVPLLKTFNELKNNDEFEVIYSLLKELKVENLTAILDQTYHYTIVIEDKLSTLNERINKYLSELTNKSELTNPEAIVKNLFIDYKVNVVDEYYQSSDNLSKYRPYIISKLNEFSIDDTNHKFFDEIAKVHGYKQIDNIISRLNNLDEIIKTIDKRNAQYIQSSISKVLFIVNNKHDISWKINKIISYFVKNKKTFSNPQFFHLSNQKYLTHKSLYKMPTRNLTPTNHLFEAETTLVDTDKENYIKSLLKSNLYSRQNITNFVLEQLEGNDYFSASNLPLSNFADYLRLIFIFLYAGTSYLLEKTRLFYKQNGFCVNNFIIRRKS